jgi:hypothetical protein
MEWIERTDSGHGERRTLFNAMVDKTPRADAVQGSPADRPAVPDRTQEDRHPTQGAVPPRTLTRGMA